MVVRRRSRGLGLLLALASFGAHGQGPEAAPEDTAAGRASIGLVLSGGGARGGAHIGVLEALEELRVPVDYIAGTSIGAAIGAFYASGMTVAELESFVEGINWDAAFLNTTPRELRSFRRKRDDDLFLVSQKPGLNRGEFELPTGVVQGQVIETVLARVILPVSAVDDFDELAIPFRAVAADIATGEAVVLGSGDLARAIRASMAVPAVLSPIEVGERLLVDGGIVMNLPVEVARDMGAERIIAVDITDRLQSREELRSVLDVTQQLTNLLTRFGTDDQIQRLGDADVFVRPEFSGDFSSVSFARLGETIQAGYDAVMAERERFEALALSPEDYAAHVARRANPRRDTPPELDFIRLDNNSIIASSVIEARLADIELGAPLDVDSVERAINRVYGLELYQNVRYDVVEEGGQTGLEVELRERSWGPNYLQLGVQYSSATDEDALFGLAASYLRTVINPRGGEWRATLVVGDEPAFLTDLYQPLGDEAMFFVAPSLEIESNLLNVFDGEDIGAEVKVREGILEIGAGRELSSWGEFRAGVRRGYGDVELRVGDPAFLPPDDFRRGEWFTRLSADTLDDISFPRRGLLASAEWRGASDLLSADSEYDQLLLSAVVAKTWGRHTLTSTFRYDSTISGTAPVNVLPRIGGFLDLSGLNNDQLTGQHAARLGTTWYRRIGDLALFPAFAGVSVEVGNAWDSRADIGDDPLFGASLWAGVDTPVGPIYVGYGIAEGGRDAFYVLLGRAF